MLPANVSVASALATVAEWAHTSSNAAIFKALVRAAASALQIACFIGRSGAATDPSQNVIVWHIGEPAAVRANLRELLFDHGRDRFIISVHLIKTLFAAERLIDGGLLEPKLALAALNRSMHAPMKGRHVIPTARSIRFIQTGGPPTR